MNSKKTREYCFVIIKVTLGVVLFLIALNWLKGQGLAGRLSKISTEVYVTLIGAIGGAFWKFYTDNEKSKQSIAQSNALASTQAIKNLENRIDSALLQIQDLRSMQLDDTNNIDKLKDELLRSKIAIAEQRHQLLVERVEILQEFYDQICKIHASLSFKKGIDEGIDRVLSKNIEELRKLKELKNGDTQT
jgi:hypothetical protein